jgi:hypothetical protein
MFSKDVSQATLYVSAKLHDTIKKPQDILEASYVIRYPNLVNTAGNSDIDAEVRATSPSLVAMKSSLRTVWIFSEKQKTDESS